jgi:hypothetical protein
MGDWLKAEELYSQRGPAQAALLIITVVLATVVTRLVVLRMARRRVAIALGSTAALLALFAVETVSLHASDAILYQPIGPVLLIGLLWSLCGLISAAAARPWPK